MKTKEIYMKPEIGLVEMESNVVIAGSIDMDEVQKDNNPARSKRRSFWMDDESL